MCMQFMGCWFNIIVLVMAALNEREEKHWVCSIAESSSTKSVCVAAAES